MYNKKTLLFIIHQFVEHYQKYGAFVPFLQNYDLPKNV